MKFFGRSDEERADSAWAGWAFHLNRAFEWLEPARGKDPEITAILELSEAHAHLERIQNDADENDDYWTLYAMRIVMMGIAARLELEVNGDSDRDRSMYQLKNNRIRARRKRALA